MNNLALASLLAAVGIGELGFMEVAGVLVPVDVRDVDEWVAALPPAARAILALGPIDEGDGDAFTMGESCGVCMALRPFKEERTHALVMVALWHSEDWYAPPEQLEEQACYLRCLIVYLAAGWDGTAASEAERAAVRAAVRAEA
jgi:hypothetical protein